VAEGQQNRAIWPCFIHLGPCGSVSRLKGTITYKYEFI
jgi:hypothetical protein